MKKKKPLPPSKGEMLPVTTEVILLRPNQWSGLTGTVEAFADSLHIIRVSYPGGEQTFPVVARFEEMKALETTSPSSRTDDPPRSS